MMKRLTNGLLSRSISHWMIYSTGENEMTDSELHEIKRRIFLNKQHQKLIEDKNSELRSILTTHGSSTSEDDHAE